MTAALEPHPIRCACGTRLGDRVGDLIVVEAHVRGRRTRTIEAPTAAITCENCGRVWRSWEPARV